jgi:uncharacterized protein YciI
MHFIVHCIDHDDALPTRLANYDAHKAYLAAAAEVRMVISGPLTADDGETMTGSCFLLEAENKDAVVRFNREDPFSIAGVWRQVSINPFLKRVDNRE